MKKIIYGFLGCLLLIAMFLGIQRLTNTKVLTWDVGRRIESGGSGELFTA